MSCSHKSGCELYVQFAADPSIQLWKTHYCDSDFSRCARFKLSLRGQTVPLHLLPNGKQIEVEMSEEDRALHALFNAIQKNRLPMVKAFLKTKVTSSMVANAEGITPVMYAASLGRDEIMQFFLEHGCNPHHRNRKGETALDIATAAGQAQCGEILREYMRKVAPPGETQTNPDTMQTPQRGALMGRILGFLRGNRPENAG